MEVFVPVALIFLFVGVGMTLTWQDFTHAFKYPRAFLFALSGQYIVYPLVCFGICSALNAPPPVALAIMLITFCPNSPNSNLYTFLFKGDTAFSVSLGAVNAIITPFTIPFLTKFAGDYFYGDTKSIELPVAKTILQGIATGVVPMFVGMMLRRFNLMFARWSKRPFEILSGIVLFILVLGLTVKNIVNIKSNLLSAVPITVLACGFGFIYGTFGKRILRVPERMSRTIAFEICMQNTLTALFISQLLGMPELIAGIGPYGIFMLILCFLYGYFLEKVVPINRYKLSDAPAVEAGATRAAA
jgi:BASS family bile acid:Na+ symporter